MFQVLTQAGERFIIFPALQSNFPPPPGGSTLGGATFLDEANGDVPLDGVAFSRLD